MGKFCYLVINFCIFGPKVNKQMNFYSILIVSLTLSFTSFAQQSPCDNLPQLLLNDTLTICEGDSVAVTPNVAGYDSFEWWDGSMDSVKWLSEEDEYIISGTFITGNLTVNGDFESGNTGFSSEYTYNATTIWGEGTYSVTTDANLVHTNLIGLGNGGTGNFMAINGTGTVNEEVWCQDVIVEPNTDYDFSAWVSSISPTNPASLQFSIDGTALGAIFNAPTTTGVWSQFNASWNSAAATTIEICITNQNTNLNGNDFGLDDINFIAYCQNLDTIEIEFVESLTDTVEDIVECASQFTISVEDPIAGSTGFWEYVAPPGAPTNVIFIPDNMQDTVDVIVPELGEYIFSYVNGCQDTSIIIVDVVSVTPEINVVAAQICDFEIALSVGNSDVQDGSWSASSAEGGSVIIDDETSASTTATVDDYGTYTFTYTFDFCEASFSQEVQILDEAPIVSVDEPYILCNRTVSNLTALIAGHGDHWEVEGPGAVIFTDFEAPVTSATVSDYGVYTFTYYGCNGSDAIEIEFVKNAPHITVPSFVECGMEAFLQVEYTGDPGTWSISNSYGDGYDLSIIDANNASLSGDEFGEYTVGYTNCDTTIESTVVFFCDLIIPNVFSPNNDGINPEFFIRRLDTRYYDKAELNVFNRWGLKVYHNGQYGLNNSWWDGKNSTNGDELIEGVYFYTLNVHNHVTNESEKYSGTINLKR